MAEWDFGADLEALLALTRGSEGPRTMSGMVQAATALIQRSRSEDPEGLERWFDENAEVLVCQQLLVANVHSQPSPKTDLSRALREWAAQSDDTSPAAAVAWLKEENPALLRAWLLSRVEDLIADELNPT